MASHFLRHLLLLSTGCLLSAASCLTSAAELSGSASYRERIALPPNAIFEATLEDVSRAGAPAEIIGRATLKPAGAPPFRFQIDYDSARIIEQHSYSLRARVTVDGRLWFTTTTHTPVITRGHPQTVELLLQRVSASTPVATPDVSLLNTYWKLMQLDGKPVAIAPNQREAQLTLRGGEQPRVTGNGGCNSFFGDYTLNGAQLSFSKLGATMMACMGGEEVERGMHAALAKTASWSVSGNTLLLLDASGNTLASFEARFMQ